MDNMEFGEVLRQARERSGEDLVSVARRIRIRPDILERIEDSDLANMPPRGYSRNMVNAYARYLGLNPTEVVKMYLDAQYRNQVERARANIKPAGFDVPGSKHHHANRESGASREHAANATQASPAALTRRVEPVAESRLGASDANGFDNGKFDDIAPTAAMSSAERAMGMRPPLSTPSRMGAVHVGSYNAYGQGLSERGAQNRSAENTQQLANPAHTAAPTRRIDAIDANMVHTPHRARRSTMSGEHYGNLYAAPSNLGGRNRGAALEGKMPFIIAAVIVLLLVVIISLVASNLGRAQAPDETQPLNITGLSDSSAGTSGKSEDSAAAEKKPEPKPVEQAPTKTVIEYSVANGETPYVEITKNGTYEVAEMLSGGAKGTFELSGDDVLDIVASPYEGLTITQDGTPIDLDAHLENGLFHFQVSFAAILEAWNAAHPAEGASVPAADAAADVPLS